MSRKLSISFRGDNQGKSLDNALRRRMASAAERCATIANSLYMVWTVTPDAGGRDVVTLVVGDEKISVAEFTPAEFAQCDDEDAIVELIMKRADWSKLS